jgi:hypothetical protein
MRGMGRLWQAAGTVSSVLPPALLEKAAACGLRSLFVGFETLNPEAMRAQRKAQNLHRDYGAAIRTRHVVFRTRRMTSAALESGYGRAYRDFYRWGSIFRGAWTKETAGGRLRHVAYAGGWKNRRERNEAR